MFARLLEGDFPGRDELRRQLDDAVVQVIDDEGSLRINTAGPPAKVVRRIPTEGEVEDADGVVLHVLLHVVDGLAHELEIFREDSGVVIGPPDASRLRVLIL